MDIRNVNIEELQEYKDNPRDNKDAVGKVAESISEFGFKVPIVVDKDFTIIAGHTRRLAARELGLSKVPVVIADDLTDEQVKAFRLADNKVAEFSQWDEDLLRSELNQLDDIDMEQFGFDDMLPTNEEFEENEEETNPYTMNVESPVYEITGEEPNVIDLYDTESAQKLQSKIIASDVPDDIKDFLIKASYRHIEFNYKDIAEYYAHASKEVQELMEDSALIIIDYNKAIEQGYVKITQGIGDVAERDDIEDDE